MGCTMATAELKRAKTGDNLREYDAYGSEDDSPSRRDIKPFARFGFGKGRGHNAVTEPKKKKKAKQVSVDDLEGDESDGGSDEENSEDDSEETNGNRMFKTKEEMIAFEKGKEIGEKIKQKMLQKIKNRGLSPRKIKLNELAEKREQKRIKGNETPVFNEQQQEKTRNDRLSQTHGALLVQNASKPLTPFTKGSMFSKI